MENLIVSDPKQSNKSNNTYNKNNKTNTTNKTNKQYTTYKCPYTDIEFVGKCPLDKCPAHIGAKHESGCLFNLLDHKKNLGYIELAYAFDTTNKQIKDCYKNGIDSILKLIQLNGWLEKVRQNPFKHFCPNCGVIKQYSGRCFSTKKCRLRAKISNRIVNKYPLNLDEFNSCQSDLWLLKYYRKYLEKDYTIPDILELTEHQEDLFEKLECKV